MRSLDPARPIGSALAVGAALWVSLTAARADANDSQATVGSVVLAPPPPIVVTPLRLQAPLPEDEEAEDSDRIFVRVTDFDAVVRVNTKRATWGLGVLRRGTVLPATPYYAGGCAGGWAKLDDGGVVCNGEGVEILKSVVPPKRTTIAADVSSPLPYRYAKVTAEGAPQFSRLPSSAEAAKVQRGDRVTSVDVTPTDGIKFIAIDRPYIAGKDVYVRTVAGEYIPQAAVEPIEVPRTYGQPLEKASLPLAFVVHDDAPVFALEGDELQRVGVAKRTARFASSPEQSIDGRDYVATSEGLLVARDHVRLVEHTAPPSDVPTGARWIHVDLDEQTLTAYEGDRPVYATLVATGIKGYDTPDGAWRIRRKYVSRRMQGPDPDKGRYDIEEVPWAMYYHAGFALHGAYWHDEFGKVRSHGCTNLPPVDARWLFHWTTPEVPEGWQGIHAAGTWVVLTRD